MRTTRAIASLEAQQASRKFGGICLRTLKTEIIVGHSVQTTKLWCVHVSVVRRRRVAAPIMPHMFPLFAWNACLARSSICLDLII